MTFMSTCQHSEKRNQFLKNSSTQKSWLTIDKLPQKEDPGELVINTKLERGLESGQSPAPADVGQPVVQRGLESSQSPAPTDVGQPVVQPAAQPSEDDPMTTVRHSHRV